MLVHSRKLNPGVPRVLRSDGSVVIACSLFKKLIWCSSCTSAATSASHRFLVCVEIVPAPNRRQLIGAVFLPTILKDMGFSAIDSQGLTAPPFFVSFLVTIFSTWIADQTQQRGFTIVVLTTVGGTGYILLATVRSVGVRYFGVFLAASGIFPSGWFNPPLGNRESPNAVAFRYSKYITLGIKYSLHIEDPQGQLLTRVDNQGSDTRR